MLTGVIGRRAGPGPAPLDTGRAGAKPGSRRLSLDRSTVALHTGVILAFLLVSLAMWWRVWITGHPTSTLTCQCGDVSEALGFLEWTPWALLHGHNPFFSSAIYAGQTGANMLTNASWMAGSLALSPLTLLFGPVLSLNVAVTLAPVVSGWCFFLAARRVSTFVPGQIAAAALYGFQPIIVTSEPYGHFFQIFLFYPPLAFICLHELFVVRRRNPVAVGAALGILTVVQFFTGTEVLVISMVVMAAGAVLAVLFAPRRAWAVRRHVARGLAAAGAVAVPLLAYPAWYALGGRAHIVGAAWPRTTMAGEPPLAIVNAGNLVHHTTDITLLAGYRGPVGPAVGFVGFGVVLFLVVSGIVWYSSRFAWYLVALGAVAWVLSLGSALQPLSPSSLGIWLPWSLLDRLPVISQVIPSRISALTVFALAMLLAVSADSWWVLLRQHRRRAEVALPPGGTGIAPAPGPAPAAPRDRGALLGAAVLTALLAAALVPLAATYTLPFVVGNTPVPPWFRQVGAKLRPDTTLLVYPYPSGSNANAMGWQAENAMHYRINGGFAIVPGGDGRHSVAVSPYRGSQAILTALSLRAITPPPLASPAALASVRSSLSKWGTDVVVVTDVGRDPPYAAGFLTAVLGRLPRLEDGAWVWYGLGPDAPLRVPPDVVTRCQAQASGDGALAVPRCVMDAASPPG